MLAPGDNVTPPWLDALSDEDADALRSLGRVRRFATGEVIFRHGEVPDFVLGVLEGRVKLVLVGPQGRNVILGFLGPGELLGDVGVLDGNPRATMLEAVDDVRALIVTKEAFERFVGDHPAAGLALMRSLARRLRHANLQGLEFATYDVISRVALRLVELCDRHGEPHERGVLVNLPLSQDELALWTGSSREAVAKALQLMRRLGWVETHRRQIIVLDPRALRDYAG